MSKTCKECGCQMEDNAQVCPQCGCPAEDAKVSAFMDADVLNEGKSTEAESTIIDYAYSILKWGNILAIFNLIIAIIYGVGFGAFIICDVGSTGAYIGVFVIIICVVFGFLSYIITKFIAKLIWASIMLFVNISTTLKRIEIKLEENGTR